MTRFPAFLAAALLAGPALAGTTGAVREVLTLPNGAVVDPLRTEDFTRTGNCGLWGCRPHVRTGETANNQFNPADRAGGSYTNSNGVAGLRYSGRVDEHGDFTLAIVDGWDQRPTTGFGVTFRGRDGAGDWGTLGQYVQAAREESGNVHIVTVDGLSPGQRIVAWFQQTSRKVRSGEIFGVGRVRAGGSCK